MRKALLVVAVFALGFFVCHFTRPALHPVDFESGGGYRRLDTHAIITPPSPDGPPQSIYGQIVAMGDSIDGVLADRHKAEPGDWVIMLRGKLFIVRPRD